MSHSKANTGAVPRRNSSFSSPHRKNNRSDSDSGAFECKVCYEEYNAEDHKPLCLDCGHSFCYLCVTHMGNDVRRICATCRGPTSKPTDELPVIFALIPSNTRPRVADKCSTHGCTLDQFCSKCKVTVCRKCVKCSHAAHQVDFIDDILDLDPDAEDFTNELKNKIATKINVFTRLTSVSMNTLEIIDKILIRKGEVKTLKDSMHSNMTTLEQLLEAWASAKEKSSHERHEIFNELRLHCTEDVSPQLPIKEISTFVEKLKQLNQSAAPLEELVREFQEGSQQKSPPKNEKLFLNGKIWRVFSEDDWQNANASVRSGRAPSDLHVLIAPGAAIQHFPETLNLLGSVCTGKISLWQLDIFWASSTMTDPARLQGYLTKFGHKMEEFYGSAWEAALICQVNQNISTLGVRLANLDDVTLCSTLPIKPTIVSCIKGLPVAAADCMMEQEWMPSQWHFPEAQAGDVYWITELLKSGLNFSTSSRRLSVILPRCCLPEEDFLRLFNKFAQHHVNIYCDCESLSPNFKSGLELASAGSQVQLVWAWSVYTSP